MEMYTGYCFKTNLLIWILMISFLTGRVKSGEDSGELTIEWTYQNPSNLLENGRNCDWFFNKACDVFFNLCLGKASHAANSGSYDCSLLNTDTKHFNDVSQVSFEKNDAYKVQIPRPTPQLYSFRMSIYDKEAVNAPERIAVLQLPKIALTADDRWHDLSMKRAPGAHENSGVRVQVRMKLECHLDWYGKDCSTYCVPDLYYYSCNEDGSRKCNAGWMGERCNKEDSCFFEPCAPHATCINRHDGMGRFCRCYGREAPECYPDYDPCEKTPCENGGVCTPTGVYNSSFRCNCTQLWNGHRCHERRSACSEEAKAKLKAEQNLTNQTFNGSRSTEVCLHGGSCYEHPDRVEVRCVCTPGWTGRRCEEKINEMILSDSLLVTLIVFICFILLSAVLVVVYICFRRKRRNKKLKNALGSGGARVYYHTDGLDGFPALSLPVSRVPVVNNVYGGACSPGSVYPDRILVVRQSSQKRGSLEKPSGSSDYDECDPLEVYVRAGIYGTIYDVQEKGKSSERASVYSNLEDVGPPLPQRPSNLALSPASEKNDLSATNVSSADPAPQSPWHSPSVVYRSAQTNPLFSTFNESRSSAQALLDDMS